MSKPDKVATHPVQTHTQYKQQARAPQTVTMRAYEVYCEVFGPQEAIVTGGCRGGFGAGELIAYLYARSFPKAEWSKRYYQAVRGMENL